MPRESKRDLSTSARLDRRYFPAGTPACCSRNRPVSHRRCRFARRACCRDRFLAPIASCRKPRRGRRDRPTHGRRQGGDASPESPLRSHSRPGCIDAQQGLKGPPQRRKTPPTRQPRLHEPIHPSEKHTFSSTARIFDHGRTPIRHATDRRAEPFFHFPGSPKLPPGLRTFPARQICAGYNGRFYLLPSSASATKWFRNCRASGEVRSAGPFR